MRGIKYAIQFKTLEGETLNYDHKTMEETIELIKDLCEEHYNLNLKITKHVVYNLIHRDSNRFLKKLCIVSKMN